MRKEAYFTLNRMVLLAIVISSVLIPLVILPKVIHPEIQQKLIPAFPVNEHPEPAFPVVTDPPEISAPINVVVEKPETPFTVIQVVGYVYLGGMLFSIFILFHGLIILLLLYLKAEKTKEQGYRVFILEKDIPAFSFCKMIFISKADYTEHGKTILTHEMQHIQLGHFYDLLLMEIVKMIHWFNPVTYWLIQDLKAIHEFQADRHTLTSGIDVNKYQLLIIEKGVGSQRFALANCFNHCQIKKRITMMNKQMTSKAGIWKVATFLPLLALLLMAFGRSGEKKQLPNSYNSLEIKKNDIHNSFFPIELREDGYYIDNKLYTLKKLSTEKKLQEYLHSGSCTSIRFVYKAGVSIPVARFVEIYNVLSQQNPKILMTMMNNADRQAEFPGGVEEMFKWLDKNTRYPKNTSISSIEEKVLVNFLITAEGKVDRCILFNYSNPEINTEALSVVSHMPAWKPAMDNGNPVAVDYTIPITFRRK
jgi:hypothetical protein